MPKKAENKKKAVNKKQKSESSPKSVTKKKKPLAKESNKKSNIGKTATTKKVSSTAKQKAALVKKLATQAESPKTPPKPSSKIPTRVRTFFGCSLLLFCISFYQAFLRPNPGLFTPPDPQLYNEDYQKSEEIVISDNPIERSTYPSQETINTNNGTEEIRKFYTFFSQKDIEMMYSMFDAPLQRSTDINRFFSAYKITPFIDNIENHQVIPENIILIDTSTSGVEEYQYNLNYRLIPQNQTFNEVRKIKIKYSDEGAKIASIHCESYRCSYNPFFRPESYGLI